MDSWESYLRRNRHRPITGNNRTTTSHHPSFSSSLLDAIYRSIDEGEDSAIVGATKEEELAVYKEKLAARRPAAEEKLVRRSVDYDAFHRRRTPAASSSSGSSYGGLSSSESESVCRRARPAADKAPPAKTFMAPFANRRDEKASAGRKAKKQPLSPGARIAGFLNSLLGSAKKAKLSSAPPSAADSPSPSPSSASSRSCLSKSRGAGGAGKRSVSFYPVSVIVDEDCRPCGQKSLYDPSPPATTRYLSEELKVHIMEKNKLVEEAADRILNRYQTRTEILLRRESWAVPPAAAAVVEEEEEDDDECCDAASDASSDLFELENLGVIGGERYREELPVYETTNVVTNRAIAHGLIL